MKLRYIRHHQGLLPSLHLTFLLSGTFAAAYTPESRWAQATFVMDDGLFVHGGKTDPFNSYSYTSAPNINELLYLPLSQPFDTATPPWQLLSNSQNASTPQAPTLAWHTLSAFNGSSSLLFGGQPGPNSPPATVSGADSAFLFEISSQSQLLWHSQDVSWINQPVRRIYHSSVTSPSGVVYIVGGQKADGSGISFSDHYAFNPQTLAFSLLPSENAPPAIYGHTSVMFADGRLFVFGGASQGTLIQLSTVWVLDTSTNSLAWTQLQVGTGTVPAPRRAFAATAIGEGKILVQGGSDANLQNNLDDGWILDTSKSPAVWTLVGALSQIGARRDHIAMYSNGLVVSGFGYSNSGPAPAALLIFNVSSNSYVSSYTPPSTTISTPTVPGSTGTFTYHPGFPTSSGGTSDPAATISPGGDDEHKRKSIAGIAVGVTLGALSAVAAVILVIVYSRRRRRRGGSFMAIGDDEDGTNSSLHASSTIPTAIMYSGVGATVTNRWRNRFVGAAFGIAETISAVTPSRNAHEIYRRRDMLADEDTREFEDWYNARRRDGTSGSSWSLKSILGPRFRSREPSIHSHKSANHRPEKTDPFSDGASLMHDKESGTLGFEPSRRPHNRREASYLSTSSYSYLDPFSDPVHEEKFEVCDTDEYVPTSTPNANSRFQPPLSTIRIVPPTSTSGHPLSPLSERTSKTSLPSNDHTRSFSQEDSNETPVETATSLMTVQTAIQSSSSTLTAKSSKEAPKSPTPLPSTIIPGSIPLASIRRSDSWWSKLYRTSILDRSPALRSPVMPEFRDPNPPPVLDPISENPPRIPSDDNPPKLTLKDSFNSRVYAADPGNSMTSLWTADTERMERLAGAMDVVQRVRMRSQRTTGSISSVDTHGTSDDVAGQGDVRTTLKETPAHNDPSDSLLLPILPLDEKESSSDRSRSPSVPLVPAERTYVPEMIPTPSSSTNPTSPVSSPSVATRVQMYQRRLSKDQEQSSPTNTRQREERSPKKSRVSVDYGFAPRPNLIIANPDHRNSRSSDS